MSTDFHASNISSLFPFTPTPTPPHSVIPRILKHTTPGVVFIGICEFIFRNEKIPEFPLSFIRGSTRLRENKCVEKYFVFL
jgi:hypothetical protein